MSCILNLKTVFLALFKLFKINEGLNLYINNNKVSFLYKSSLLLSASFEAKDIIKFALAVVYPETCLIVFCAYFSFN